MKRRSSAAVTQACVPPSVKRTKVQAQRKFAQNNYTYSGSRVIAKTPEEYKAPAMTIPISSPENEECDLNTFSSLPTVDDLLTFLCFRGTDVLPAKLNYLSNPQFDPSPQPKKYSKTNDGSILPSNNISMNLVANERNNLAKKGETNYRGSKKLDECKKLRSRNLTNKSISKTSRSLALKHNQRLRSKNVVKAKICESKLKSKPMPQNVLPSVTNVSNGRSTRTSTRRRIDMKFASSSSPDKRVTRRNIASPKLLDTSKELPKRVKSIAFSSSCKTNSLITSELSVRLEDPFSSSKSLALPKFSTASCNEITAAAEETIKTPIKPFTRSTQRSHDQREVGLRSTRSQSVKSTGTPEKRSNELSTRTTRSGSMLLNDGSRNSPTTENKTEDVPSNVRPSRRTKEAAAFYMELLGKDLLCPGSEDDDSCSVDSFPELPSNDQYLRRERELEREHQKSVAEKVTLRKLSRQKFRSTNPSTSQVKFKSSSRRASEFLESKNANESSTKSLTSQIAENSAAREATETVALKNSNEQSTKSSITQVTEKPASRRVSDILELKNSNELLVKPSVSQMMENFASRRASDVHELKHTNEQSVKSSTSQLIIKHGLRRASEILESKNSNEQSAKSSSSHVTAKPALRRISKILDPKKSDEETAKSPFSHVTAKSTLRRVSEILEPKSLSEQSSKLLTNQTTVKPLSRRASEILIPKNSNEQPAKSSTNQVIVKSISRRSSMILDRRKLNEHSAKLLANQIVVKSVSRRASEILEPKDSVQQSTTKSSVSEIIAKPVLGKASEILDLKNSNEQSAKPISRRAELQDSVQQSTKSSTNRVIVKPLSRRAAEILTSKSSTEQSAKSSINLVTVQPVSRRTSATLEANHREQLEKSSSNELEPKSAMRRASEVLGAGKSRESENKAIISNKLECNEIERIEPIEKVGAQVDTSPTTIEVTIKDLTKRQKPEKSVFKKKVLSVKKSASNVFKDHPCKEVGTQIRDLTTKSSTVELIKMTTKESSENDDSESSVVDTAKTNKNDERLVKSNTSIASSSSHSDTSVAKRSTSPSSMDMSRMANLAEKKIFRKNDVELNRKSDAFSPDNEKSVYAFEPDLPTTSPPFRRLKPATPPKMLSVNNSVAVQVNFGKDVKVECSSTGDTRVSSTTDSEGDRVFYIPIQTSAATSTLGVAVKLGTDGPNQKIFMSATLITNSPAFTTNTVTNVQAKSTSVESPISLSHREERPMILASSSAVGEDVNEQTLKNRKAVKSSPVKVQSVKILKLNRNKKVDQGTNVDMMSSKFKSTSICKNRKVDQGTSMDLMKTKSEPTLISQQSKKIEMTTQTIKEGESTLKHQNKKVEIANQSTSKYDSTTVNPNKKVDTIVRAPTVEISKAKPEPTHLSKNKKIDVVNQITNVKYDSRVKSKKEETEKLPISEVMTKKFNSVLSSQKVDSLTRTTNHQNDDIASRPASTSSASYSTLSKNSAQSKSSVKIVKVNKSKKVESSDNSSGTDSPVPAAAQTHNVDVVVTKKNAAESKLTKMVIPETKSKVPKVKMRSQKCKNTEPSSSTLVKKSKSSGEILQAPTFRPSKEEFNDPLEYIESIRPVAEKFGLCRIVPPSDFRPECKVADEMRFTAYNQYVHKMLHRWGPNVKEMLAIRKFLATQNIQLTQAPWIGGMEVDLPRLYQTVQQCGGLSAVIESGRWQAVADMMRIPKLAQDRITKLDDIYCKYLLPYDILSHEERERIFDDIEKEWAAHLKKSSDDELFEDVDECVLKGRTMPLSCFYRIARNTMMMCFGNQTDSQKGPSTETIEREFWNHVSDRKAHICVHSGSIDSGTHGYGFSVAKNSTFRKHPWNLKVLTNNAASILRFLGPLMGVTVPTLHVGMLYSAFCWYRDPHGLPWIEYLHTGADKIWYGIPDEHSEQFREAMLVLAPRFCRDKKIWLSSDTVMIPPPLLMAEGVSLSRVVQQPGQFIVVFPKAFTSSISTGYLVSESVYFAQASWLDAAKQIFTDMRDSCEPSVFSLEQLLISIAEDTRPNVSILTKILPLLSDISETESHLRVQLRERGVNIFERLNTNKKRKSKSSFQEEEYYECDVCHSNLFVSTVANSHKQNFYCLQHAVTMLQKKSTQAKHCKLLYAYTEEELTELVDKVKSRIEAKSAKK